MEIKRLTGSYNTMVGNNEGSMVRRTPRSTFHSTVQDTECCLLQVLGLKLPNMLGRAEKLTFQFSYGTKETSYGLSFFKPQPGFFERKYVGSGADGCSVCGLKKNLRLWDLLSSLPA